MKEKNKKKGLRLERGKENVSKEENKGKKEKQTEITKEEG